MCDQTAQQRFIKQQTAHKLTSVGRLGGAGAGRLQYAIDQALNLIEVGRFLKALDKLFHGWFGYIDLPHKNIDHR